MALSQTWFHNARNLEVNNAQFFSIANSNGTIINNGFNHDAVLATLLQHIAAGANFDSAERYPPGKCYPGSREKIMANIIQWITDPKPDQHILWMYGPAGAGKSAIAQSICERLRQDHADKYGGSFFFAKGAIDRGNATKLFATLSYQLAVQYPALREEINKALLHDPSLPTKSMEVQLSSLIVQPLLRCQHLLSQRPTLIVDGLDECANDPGMDAQCRIITLISESIVGHRVALRFMIASRPEFWLRDLFQTAPLQQITRSLSLREDEDADKDIRAYLTNEFENIRVKNKRTMASVRQPWPPAHVINHFVYQASGQYIYASTVLKFVGKSSKFSDPQEQLSILTSPGPNQALAFSELDRLYETILSAYPRWETMKQVLGGILIDACSTVIQIALGVNPTEMILVFDALSALINVQQSKPLSKQDLLLEPFLGCLVADQEGITFVHLSFREFLQDKTRSGLFHVDTLEIWHQIHRCFFGTIHRNLIKMYDTPPYLLLNIGVAKYHQMMSDIANGHRPHEQVLDSLYGPMITDMTHKLLNLDPEMAMKNVQFFFGDMVWLLIFLRELMRGNVDNFRNSIRKLAEVICDTRNRRIRQWSQSMGSNFSITPTLAYLNEFGDFYNRTRSCSVTIDHLLKQGLTITDILGTVQQHRDIISVRRIFGSEIGLTIIDLTDNLDYEVVFDPRCDPRSDDEGWRTQGEWRHQRTLLAYQHLKNTMINGGPFDEFLERFFNSQNLSDIQTADCFKSAGYLSILALIADHRAWRKWSSSPQQWNLSKSSIIPILYWFHRQLTSPQTLRVLEDHNRDLILEMRKSVKIIFQYILLPDFQDFYYSNIHTLPLRYSSTILQVFPFTENRYSGGLKTLTQHMYFPGSDGRHIYDELIFSKPCLEQGIIPPLIDHIYGYPYLASHLLNSLVDAVFTTIYKKTIFTPLSGNYFKCIAKFLPHAPTTQKNLNSLRAIAHLFPHATLNWGLPMEFWDLCVEFLRAGPYVGHSIYYM